MDNIKNLEARVEVIEKWIIKQEKKEIINSYDMKELIINSITKGLEPLNLKLDDFDDRINVLENYEAEKLKAEDIDRKENKKAIIKQITINVIVFIITFFVTIVLNNLATLDTIEQRVEDKFNYDKQLIEKEVNNNG